MNEDTSMRSESDTTTSTQNQSTKSRGLLGFGLAIVFASAAFFSGMQIGVDMDEGNMTAGIFSPFTASADPESDANLESFWRVWNLLEDKYVSSTTTDPVTNETRMHGAIEGLVDSYGDPYTTFLPPEDASQFEETISGNFSGVGMEVGMRDGLITVISPLPQTPAEEAGVLAGDVIVEIDGEETENMSIDEAVKLIRGEKGSTVELTIFREGEDDFLTIEVVRDTIEIPTIETEQIGDTYIIRLYNFNALAEMRMQEALREYVSSDAEKLIFDLRGNPGGYLQSAVSIASYFLPTGDVVVREHFGENTEDKLYRSTGKMIHEFNEDSMVVLVDRGSASASEIVAGALREHGVATLIGETTFGKGSVQELVPLPDNASLKVTIARWLTPDGTSFSEVGLEPDLQIARSREQVLEEEDPQQDAALRWLAGDRDIEETEEENPLSNSSDE